MKGVLRLGLLMIVIGVSMLVSLHVQSRDHLNMTTQIDLPPNDGFQERLWLPAKPISVRFSEPDDLRVSVAVVQRGTEAPLLDAIAEGPTTFELDVPQRGITLVTVRNEEARPVSLVVSYQTARAVDAGLERFATWVVLLGVGLLSIASLSHPWIMRRLRVRPLLQHR